MKRLIRRRAEASDRVEAGDRGSVTLEFAVLLPALILLVSVVIGVAALTTAQIRGTDAARQAARMSAVGEERSEIDRAVEKILPGQVNLQVSRDGDWVSATVSHRVTVLGKLQVPLTVTSTAKALVE